MANNGNNNYGQSFVVTISNNELIDNLRSEIYNKCAIAPNHQILHFNNKLLITGTRLNEYYGLDKNSTITVHYKNEKDWFRREEENIQNNISKLTQHINNLHSEEEIINNLTKDLCLRISSAPTLKQLSECKIEDNNDCNMSQLNNLINNFKHKINASIRNTIDESMSNLQILISNALCSINSEEEIKCNQINKKMEKIEYKIKLLEKELTQLETSKATLLSKYHKYKTDLNILSNKYIINNKSKIDTT
eukprot:489165_1